MATISLFSNNEMATMMSFGKTLWRLTLRGLFWKKESTIEQNNRGES